VIGGRRQWLKTAAGLLVAPAVVRAESLMRVRPFALPPERVRVLLELRRLEGATVVRACFHTEVWDSLAPGDRMSWGGVSGWVVTHAQLVRE